MKKTLAPAKGPLKGRVAVPGDKSIGHRSLLLGALAEGGLKVRNLPQGEDLKSTRRCLTALGVSFKDEDGGVVSVNGEGAAWKAPGPLDCGNSGTTMRLLMGLLSGKGVEAMLTGDASLSRRPMARVAGPLRRLGADFELTEGKFAPLKVLNRAPLQGARQALEVPSAQVKSALLLAGLFAEGETVVEDPYGTRDHSERMLGALAPGLLRIDGPAIHIHKGALKGGLNINLPGDPSSAAFFTAAALLVPGSELTIGNVGLNPGRLGYYEVLQDMGAMIDMPLWGEEAGEPVGELKVSHSRLHGLRVPAERIPSMVDEVPMLAVLATAAQGKTRIEGLSELRHKESDRLEGVAAALKAMGAQVRVDGDALEIDGPTKLKGAAIETLGDHRIALAFSVAALAAEGETTLSDADCAAVSFPNFYTELAKVLG